MDKVELAASVHHLPTGAKAIRMTNPGKWIDLTLGVKRKKELPDLKELDDKQPRARKYVSREQLREEYGSDPAAVATIEAFAKEHNLMVTKNHPASARLGLAGTVRDLSAAFGVTLFDYKHPTLGQFHARTGPIRLPAEIAEAVTGVFGFNNHRVLHRKSRTLPKRPDLAMQTRAWFVPSELATIYDFPDAKAQKQCIGLLEFGGGVEQTDVEQYFKRINLPVPTLQIVALDGVSTDPAADPDSTGEVMLDIDVAGALAGGATLAVYFSTFDEKGIIDCLSRIIERPDSSDPDPSVLSVSWGWAENQPFNHDGTLWSSAAMDHVNHSFLAAAQLGISVCVSTGDDGSEAQVQDGRAHVNFPASSPYVLAVGGTTLHARTSDAGAQQLSETVWNDGPGSGTGGGVSDYTPVPSWQAGKVPASINPGAFKGRALPDVAANADPETGYLVMSGGQLQIVGGTSASAPLWASLIARINALIGARCGNFNALLYSSIGSSGALRDITSGNNDTDGLLGGRFQAATGWDACTGWGVPGGQALYNALK